MYTIHIETLQFVWFLQSDPQDLSESLNFGLNLSGMVIPLSHKLW